MTVVKAVVFDFGGVLIDWNPEYLYRELIPDDAERRWFLTHVCSMDWVVKQDAGQPIAEATDELIARFPDHEASIRAFYDRWHEMLRGEIADSVATLDKLDAAGVPLFGLTNWSAQTFPYAWERYPVLRRFRDVVVSGRARLAKPDPAIFAEMFRRIDAQLPGVKPGEIAFIDDNVRNIDAAGRLGWQAVLHTNATQTEARLRQLGLAV